MPDDGAPEDGRLRLAYDEGLRVLTQQRDDLERIRTRVVTLVSVASIAAALLGGFTTTKAPHRPAWLYVGLGALGVLIVCVCVILAPHWTIFENDPRVILTNYVDDDRDLNETLRWTAYYSGENAASNRATIDFLVKVYLVAVVALGVTVVTFALALAERT